MFHDNCWQNTGSLIYGESVAGAYVRKLTSFSGGYSGTGGEHSDVHLWYHGTIDTNIPASYVEDGSTVTINSSMRTNWWNAYESRGAVAGFNYSLVGGGNRLSPDRPLGACAPAIVDGFNQFWDLGAGTANNRTALSTNSGNWPNLIRLNRAATNAVVQGQSTPLKFYYQWARPAISNATISLYLDDDLNPFSTNQTLLKQFTVPANGAGFVGVVTTNLTLFATNAAPGVHNFFAAISGGGRTRFLYAPEPVEVISIRQPPVLDIAQLSATQIRIGVAGLPGQNIVLQQSADLRAWQSLATNTLAGTGWLITNTVTANPGPTFYRAVFTP